MSLVNKALTIGVSLVILGAVLPTAIFSLIATDTTNWNSAVATIYSVVLPLLAVIGIVFWFMPRSKKGSAIPSRVIQIAVVLMVIAAIVPYGISQLASMPSTTVSGTVTYTVNSAVLTMLRTVVPILAIIGIALFFLTTTASRMRR
jgi:ATP-dependent Zn protease